MIELEENKGKLALNFLPKKFSPSVKIVFVQNIQFGDGETVNMAFNVKLILFDEITEVVNFSITQKYNRAIFCFEDEGLIGLEGLIHDGESMKADPDIGESFEAGVVGSSVLKGPEIGEMK
jgi:hypothetical protein